MILKPEERREIFYLYGIDFVDSKQGKPTEVRHMTSLRISAQNNHFSI
jgi:hypothetical protein